MSKMSELSYDIEQMYIAGFSARSSAVQLECPEKVVDGVIESNFVADTPQEDLSPFETINS